MLTINIIGALTWMPDDMNIGIWNCIWIGGLDQTVSYDRSSSITMKGGERQCRNSVRPRRRGRETPRTIGTVETQPKAEEGKPCTLTRRVEPTSATEQPSVMSDLPCRQQNRGKKQ